MGFFSFLGNLLSNMISWLGQAFTTIIKGIISIVESLWYSVIAVTLVAAFGYAAILFAIFYAGRALGETIMEIWNPKKPEQPSRLFSIKQADSVSIPAERSNAKVMELSNINY